MKDYANRNFGYSDVQQQVKVPIHWGFIIAALVAMLVIYSVWHHRQSSQVLLQVQPLSSPSAQAPQAGTSGVANVAPAVTSAKTQAVAPAKVSTPPVKFDFYQMLTENPSGGAKAASSNASSRDQETTVKANHLQGSAQTDTQATVQANAQYYIQIGSYRSKAEALQQKANLILSEVSPKLIKVVNANGHYRVLIGPYNKQASAAAERSDLKQNGINGSLIKDNDLKSK